VTLRAGNRASEINSELKVKRLELGDVEQWWREAFLSNASLSPQQSFEWVSAWCRHFGRSSLRLNGIVQGAELLSVLPTNDDGRRPSMLRSAPTLVNDSFAAIAPHAERSLQASAQAVAAVLDDRAGRPLLLESVSPVLVPVLRRIDPRCNGLVVRWDTNPRLDLTGDWEEYLGRLTGSQRADVRRLARRGAEMQVRSVHEADEVAVSTRLSLEQRRRVWSESGLVDKMSPFQREPAWDEFLVDAARSLAEVGLASVGELVCDGDVVASALLLQRGAWLLGYHRSAERSQMKFGQIFDVLLLQDAIGRGVRTIEMGRGSEAWKYRLGARDVAICDIVVGHARLATLAAMAARVTPFLARRLVRRSGSRSSTAGRPSSPRTTIPTVPSGSPPSAIRRDE
jgi:CelD/BcsL family acetyltransferase involved in cellulose biosynthesis